MRTHLAIVAAALAVAVAVPARGSVVDALDLATLVRSADHIVVADVVGQTARWDARRRIVTDVELVVVDSMKGGRRVGDALVLTRFGGAIGELGMRVEGEPMFSDGERVVVFARASRVDPGSLRAVGMAQGVMRVDHDVVLPGAPGLALVQRGADGQLRPAPPALIAPRALSSLTDEIRSLAAGQR